MSSEQKLLEKITITINKAVKNTRAYEKAQYFFVGTFILIGIVAVGTIYNNKLLSSLYDTNKKNIQEINKKIDNENETINSNIDLICSKTETINSNIETINSNIDLICSKTETINSKIEIINCNVESIHSKIESIHSKFDLLFLSNKKITYILENKITSLNPFLINSPLMYLNENDKSDPPSERISEINMDEDARDYEVINNSYDALPCNNIKLTGIMSEQ